MNNSHPGSKRRAEEELRKEDVEDQDSHRGGRDDDETFATEPQLASAEEMQKRRIVRARRPGTAMNSSASNGGGIRPGGEGVQSGNSTSAFPATGLFKSLESFSTAPSAPTAFAFSGSASATTSSSHNNNPLQNSVGSSTASTGTTTSSGVTSSGMTSAASPASDMKLPASTPFSFPTTATTTSTTKATTTPPTSFGFGSSAFGGTPVNEGIPPLSSSSSSGTTMKPFSFSFGSFSKPANNSSTSTTTTTAAVAAPIFPPGAFSFANAASSFAEARKNAEQEQRERASKEGNNMEGGVVAGEEGVNTQPDDKEVDPSSGFLSSTSSISSAPGEVLALAPCKLYRFEKGGNKWVECGEGEAKLKLEKRKKKSSVVMSSEVGEKKETAASSPSATGTATEEGEEEEEVARLLVRDGYSLNAVVKKGLFLVTGDASPTTTTGTGTSATPQNTSENNARKHLVFVVYSGEDGPIHYLLKLTGGAAEDNAQRFSVKIKEVMEKEK